MWFICWNYEPICLVTKFCPTFLQLYKRACQSPLSVGYPRQDYRNGFHFLPQGIFLTPGIEPASPPLTGRIFTTETPGKLYDPILIHHFNLSPSFTLVFILCVFHMGFCKCKNDKWHVSYSTMSYRVILQPYTILELNLFFSPFLPLSPW